MEKRIVLFEFECKYTFDEIVNKLLAKRYTKESNSGFILNKSNFKEISFKHIKNIITSDKVTSPFGDVFENSSIDYAINDIRISETTLCITNPTRSLIPLKNDILASLDFQCLIYAKEINLEKLVSYFENHYELGFVTELDVVSYDFFEETKIKLSLSSNKSLVSKSNDFLKGLNSKILKLSAEIFFQNEVYTLTVNDKGSLKLSGKIVTKEIELFSLDLINSFSKKE